MMPSLTLCIKNVFFFFPLEVCGLKTVFHRLSQSPPRIQWSLPSVLLYTENPQSQSSISTASALEDLFKTFPSFLQERRMDIRGLAGPGPGRRMFVVRDQMESMKKSNLLLPNGADESQ